MPTPAELAESARAIPHGVAFAGLVTTVDAPSGDTVYTLTLVFQVDPSGQALKQTFAMDEELAKMLGLDQAQEVHDNLQEETPT